jgi:Mannosyltransferase (PIG-V)
VPAVRAADIWKRCPLALRDTLPAWILARVIVLGSLGAARFVVDEYPRSALARNAQVTLLGWDAGIYNTLARFGYASDPESYRFFPLYPLATRALDVVTPGSTRVALVLLANVCALGFAVLIHRLVMLETNDADAARRASWFACIAPPAFVMVWGYAEPMFLLLSVATFLMLRTNRFAAAALFAALAALTRPLGVVIAIPAAVEAWRGIRTVNIRSRVERVAAVVAAPLGTLVFLVWTRDRTGDLLAPYRIQAEATHRGRMVDPFTGVANALSEFFDHDRIGPLLHIGWAVVAIGLVVIAFRRLPVSYGLFAAATVVIALSSRNLDSFERYAFNAFPLLIAAALIVRSRRFETLVFTAMGAAMCLYAMVAALGVYVP